MIASNGASMTKPSVRYFASQNAQTTHLVQTIKEYIDSNKYTAEEIAILSPINSTLYVVEEALTKAGIPNVCLEGQGGSRVCKKFGSVCLGTIHKAKGLEWDVVFFINVSDEIIPKMKDSASISDNRKVFYVAVTRPKKELHISFTAKPAQPYVSRYVSEIPMQYYTFHNFSQQYVNGTSSCDAVYMERSVGKLIDLLNTQDIIALKEQAIIPPLTENIVKKCSLYPSHDYSADIVKEGLQVDFANFLSLMVYRHGCNDTTDSLKHAYRLLSSVQLEQSAYRLYNKHVRGQLHTPSNQVISRVPSRDVMEVSRIIQRIHSNALEYGINPSLVPVGQSNIPADFKDMIKASIETVAKDSNYRFDELWNVAKCKRIVDDQRRKLMYKDDIMGTSIFVSNKDLIETMLISFSKFIENTGFKVLKTNVYVMHPSNTFHTMIDVLGEKTFMTLKVTSKDDIDIMCIIESFLKCSILKAKNIDITRFYIFNPLRGHMLSVDVPLQNELDALLSFMIAKWDSIAKSST
jgi:hypothetical protein